MTSIRDTYCENCGHPVTEGLAIDSEDDYDRTGADKLISDGYSVTARMGRWQ